MAAESHGFSAAGTDVGHAAGVADEVARVLVVDDQTSNLEALEVLLAPSGCQLVRAQSADEALLALLDQDFAAIVLDIKMPDMSGLELAALIKRRRRTRHVPILFLTAHMIDPEDVLRGYGTGAVDYLTKPIQAEILRSKIAVFIELFRKGRELARANVALRYEVHEREKAEDALRRANQELEHRVAERTAALEQADRRKDEFLASLAHELRNPLAPVRAAVEIIRDDRTRDTDREHARAVIVRQVEHMTRLIDDLLDVSRITSDKLALQIEPIELGAVISSAVETSRPFIAARNHALEIRLPADHLVLQADPARLAQVLSNLLTNAAKYTMPGGHIAIAGEAGDGHAVIRVIDSGIGIDPTLLPVMFELFVQGDRVPGGDASGLGVGLTLARRLVEMHGGTLEARSDGPGLGSEFVVTVPLSIGGMHEARPAPANREESLLRQARILVVDDNEDAAEMLALLLTSWGQDVRVAHDGLGALELAETFRPEMVLLDLGLPQLDGFETARRFRAQPWGRETVLVAVTGWGRESDRQRSREACFDEHLVKPILPEVLRHVVARAQAGEFRRDRF